MADRPVRRDVLAGDGTWVENRPSKWQQIRNILSPYVTAPINAMERLVNSPAIQYGYAPTEQDVADSFALAGLVTGGSAFAPKPQNAMTMGIRAYHGSPHDFPEFSTAKIGTGEGAQAYSRGLYFAENENVARWYRDALSGGGKKLIAGAPEDVSNPVHMAASLLADHSGNRAAAAQELLAAMQSKDVPQGFETLAADTLQLLRSNAPLPEVTLAPGAGKMYEVDINAKPEELLDWDAPLKDQSVVNEKLRSIGWDTKSSTTTGRDRVIRMEDQLGPEKTRQELLRAGIPGVKYLDRSSRGAGKGTRNYVVFDDRLISIVRKYGIAGASAMLGYNILDNISEAQAEELRRIEKGTELRK